MDDIPNIVTDPIFNGLYKLLQGMGAIVRWLFFLGNCPPEKIQNDRHLNTFGCSNYSVGHRSCISYKLLKILLL